MTPHRNPTGMIAILVSSTLYLPSGRPVPADDVTGWEPSDDEPEDASPACYATALAHQRQIDALGPVKPAPRSLPVLGTPRPFAESPAVALFKRRCEALATVLDERTDNYHAWARTKLRGMAEQAQRGGASTAMWRALDQIEHATDPATARDVAAEAAEWLAWVASSGLVDEAYFTRRLTYIAECATAGHISRDVEAQLGGLRKRLRAHRTRIEEVEGRYR